jgi:hypothetical protein
MIPMKLTYYITAIFIASFLVVLAADPKPRNPFAGTWLWTFTMPDGTKAEPKVKLQEVEGRLVGTSSFRPGTAAPVTNLTVQGDALAFDVIRERNGQQTITHYSGQLSGDTIQGKIQSNWSGEKQTYPWEAQRLAGVDGTWRWTNSFGRTRGEAKLKLKSEGQKVTGKLSAFRREVDIHGGKFVDEDLSFRTVLENEGEKYTNRYYGKVIGDVIEGKAELNLFGRLRTNDWTAYRAD